MKGVDYQNLVTTAFESKSRAKAYGGNRNLMSPGFRYFDAKLNHSNHSDIYNNDRDCGFYPRIPSDRLVPSRFRSMNYNKVDGSSTSNVDSGVILGFGKNGSSDVKRKVEPVGEMVSSIKMLGEGFVRMEKMTMEMAREIEKMRMEAEMKRNEMIIESQQQIVDVFVNALLGKKRIVKMEKPPHS